MAASTGAAGSRTTSRTASARLSEWATVKAVMVAMSRRLAVRLRTRSMPSTKAR